jgi:archaemetzincin
MISACARRDLLLSLSTVYLTSCADPPKGANSKTAVAGTNFDTKPHPLNPDSEQRGNAETPGQAATLPEEVSETSPKAAPKVYLQPLGEGLPADDLQFVQAALELFYQVDVFTLKTVKLPSEALYAPRSRYRAEKLLDHLKTMAPEDAHLIMGLTGVDISTTKAPHQDWGILGLATVDGGQCVISKFRAQRGATSKMHALQRLAKTVIHEVGHTLGLYHCPNFGCLMEDGKGSVKTSDHEYDLCGSCRTALGKWVKALPEGGPPWPKPS